MSFFMIKSNQNGVRKKIVTILVVTRSYLFIYV